MMGHVRRESCVGTPSGLMTVHAKLDLLGVAQAGVRVSFFTILC